jgi:hypothetical protein
MGGVTISSDVSDFHTTLVHERPPIVTAIVDEIGPKNSPVTCTVTPLVDLLPSIWVILGLEKKILAGFVWLTE